MELLVVGRGGVTSLSLLCGEARKDLGGDCAELLVAEVVMKEGGEAVKDCRIKSTQSFSWVVRCLDVLKKGVVRLV